LYRYIVVHTTGGEDVNADEFQEWQREMQDRLDQERRQFLHELHRHRYGGIQGNEGGREVGRIGWTRRGGSSFMNYIHIGVVGYRVMREGGR